MGAVAITPMSSIKPWSLLTTLHVRTGGKEIEMQLLTLWPHSLYVFIQINVVKTVWLSLALCIPSSWDAIIKLADLLNNDRQPSLWLGEKIYLHFHLLLMRWQPGPGASIRGKRHSHIWYCDRSDWHSLGFSLEWGLSKTKSKASVKLIRHVFFLWFQEKVCVLGSKPHRMSKC